MQLRDTLALVRYLEFHQVIEILEVKLHNSEDKPIPIVSFLISENMIIFIDREDTSARHLL